MIWILTLSMIFNFLMTVALIRTGLRLNELNKLADVLQILLGKIKEVTEQGELCRNIFDNYFSAMSQRINNLEDQLDKLLTKDSEGNRN